jgi:hypothetical protein
VVDGVRFEISHEWYDWERKFGELERGVAPHDLESGWEEATGRMFEATKSVVHVRTGQLRGSGHWYMEPGRRGELIGVIEYTAPYAGVENARGGEHAFMERGYVAVEADMDAMLGDAWQAIWTVL